MASSPGGGGGGGARPQRRAASPSSAEESPPRSSWADLLSAPSAWLSSPASAAGCGCLTQVDDGGGWQEIVEDAADEDIAPSAAATEPDAALNVSLVDDDEGSACDDAGDGRGGADDGASVRERTASCTQSDILEGMEVATGECCPICLEDMATADVLYPIACPGACRYNFCVNCMSALLRSSRDDYQLASDGSRRLKVHLKCPNCRYDISGVIEEVIRLRREAFAEPDEADLSTSRVQEQANAPALVPLPVAPSAVPPRLKNRSGAPRPVREKRWDELTDEVESMPVPSAVRDRALALQGGLLQDDALSQSFSVAEGELKSSRFGRRSSRTHRRARSFETPSRSTPKVKKASPRSVMDLAGAYTDNPERQAHSAPQEKTLEGINCGGGFLSFANAIELGWCCFDSSGVDAHSVSIRDDRSVVSRVEGRDGCGGYVDYSGIYHPCTSRGESAEVDGTCQGCIFRRGMYVAEDTKVHEDEEELFYDSDPGQHYAIGSWARRVASKNSSPSDDDSSASAPDTSQGTSGGSGSSRRRSKSVQWKPGRRKSRARSSSGEASSPKRPPTPLPTQEEAGLVTPERRTQGEEQPRSVTQEDQQAYLYDYFSRNDNAGASPMKTGICSTREEDAGQYVQEALNSKWKLRWHVNIAGGIGCLPPKTSEVWIERGYRLNRLEIVEPKLMWRELAQPNLYEAHQLGGSTLRPYRVSLFALRRILRVASAADLEAVTAQASSRARQHAHKKTSLPAFAKPDCLILVCSSLGDNYIFEASCAEERDHIVHLWKMATARLVSHAVVGNGGLMLEEYFNDGFIPGGADVSLVNAADDEVDL